MGDKQSFLIHVTDGVAEVSRAKNTSTNRWDSYGLIPLSDVPIPALQLGLKVEALVPDDCEALDPLAEECPVGVNIMVICRPIEPPEPVGVEYLRSLTLNMPYSELGLIPFVPMSDGLHWPGEIWRWDGSSSRVPGSSWQRQPWVKAASAETIKPWVGK